MAQNEIWNQNLNQLRRAEYGPTRPSTIFFSKKISRMPIFSLKNPSYFKQWKRSLEKTRATGNRNIQHNELEIDKILQFQ